EGSLHTLLGPSGCGKTTTLRCIAGLERPDGGEIVIGDRIVAAPARGLFVPPERRGLGMVFQSYALWPHLTVHENIAFGLRQQKRPRAEVEARVAEVLALTQLTGLETRYPSEISGGQQQRVALARSLALRPGVLLFDEPLSNLDAKLRESMRLELRELQRALGTTSVYVTHDQVEALVISDQISVMHRGRVLQTGTARELYERPADPFVADFLGASNFIRGRVADGRIAAEAGLTIAGPIPPAVGAGREVLVSLRPERLTVHAGDPNEATNCWRGELVGQVFAGDHVLCRVMVNGREMRARVDPFLALANGRPVWLHIPAAKVTVIPLD
ncbi:MAG: ABC transporter ATP-binding protein, partial [Candidatus Rokubacteria bacterium]|nr:ABC transporter ATP-binding protein [Candidatus Rokubacteria bacterium]